MNAFRPGIAEIVAILLSLSAPIAVVGTASAQESGPGKWADENDPLAKQLVEQERKWATLACAPRSTSDADVTAFIEDLIAADFIGTSPTGSLYSRSDMMPKNSPRPEPGRDCKLLSAKVRFIGSDMAVIYGRESATIKGADGHFAPRTLVWTDTLLRRSGKWQIVAVQDMVVPTK